MTIPRNPPRIFETQSEAWEEVGLLRQINPRTARRARLEALFLIPVFVAIVVIYDHREQIFSRHFFVVGRGRSVSETTNGTLVTIAVIVVLVILGWAIARDIGRALGPSLFRRMDPATAGTVGFLIRVATLFVAVLVALAVAGVDPKTIAFGGALTAVVFGLAAQQTLGNLIAGTVLLSARPFRVGEKVRLQGGPIGGQLEGTVGSLGLLYTTFVRGEDSIMVPNSVVLNVAVMPLHEPDGVSLRARLPAGMTPADLQELLGEIKTPTRTPPRIALEEIDGDEVVVTIAATPRVASQGNVLAGELQSVVARETAGERTP
ncbi:MAG TPA: mechanosensitive ion channel family protein [Solirubrobacteraceae bacterium]|nr:mechanosensitive ion channel family protein [Solirubrobacteraceae bacterium]